MPPKQNKVKINATISPRLRDKALALSDGNLSNFVGEAIAYYAGSLEKERELKQKEADEAAISKQSSEKDYAALLLRLVTAHPELLQEITESKNEKGTSKSGNLGVSHFEYVE